MDDQVIVKMWKLKGITHDGCIYYDFLTSHDLEHTALLGGEMPILVIRTNFISYKTIEQLSGTLEKAGKPHVLIIVSGDIEFLRLVPCENGE